MRIRLVSSMLTLCILGAGMTACAKSESSSGSVPDSETGTASAATTSGTYEIVVIDRPESVAHYHKLYAATYDICAATRKVASLPPPPPMKQPPPDYIIKRETYIGDASRSYLKREHFTYVVENGADPDRPTCETREDRSTEIWMLRDGLRYYGARDENGAWKNDPPEEVTAERKKDGIFTEPKVVKGIAMKCLKPVLGMEKLVADQCVIDLKPGTVYFDAEPIELTARIFSVEKLQGVIAREPVLVKLGQKVDPKVFELPLKP